MKKVFLLLVAAFSIIVVQAQKNPVNWKFTSKKISDKVYEVHLVATVESGWHIYSQTQPKDAIAIPTKIVFSNNPLVKTEGGVKEVGKLETFHDASIGVSANQFSKTVEFVQKVTLKVPAKTNVGGSVTFQTCNDKECLPPKKVDFKIDLG